MHRRTQRTSSLILTIFLSLIFIQPALAQTDEEPPIVHAILFYSPTCPHCHKVIQEDLPPLIEKYGNQLMIVGINTQSIEGQEIYQAMVEKFQIPDERIGVPALVVGETVMVGSLEIPTMFPEIIEEGLQAGGIDWPPIPGFVEAYTASVASAMEQATAQAEATTVGAQDSMPTADASGSAQESAPIKEPTAEDTDQAISTPQPTKPTSTPETVAHADEAEVSADTEHADQADPSSMEMALPDSDTFISGDQTMIEKFKIDPVGNSASVVVLVGMLISLGGVWRQLNKPLASIKPWGRWAIPALCVVGLVVAGYLSYVEITQTEAVCGPVGDCNTVQQSPYARLFGILPIGVLGLLGYVAIAVAWGIQSYGPIRWRKQAALALWGMALFGTLFSIYLTFLEPFVIGATCAWCLSSAIIITLIFWVATFHLNRKEYE